MPRAEQPKARLGWVLAGEFMFEPNDGPVRLAAEALAVHLRNLGRIESIDVAQVDGFLMLSEAVDADPTNAALWGQWRTAEVAMRGIGASDEPDALAELLASLSGGANVLDATVTE